MFAKVATILAVAALAAAEYVDERPYAGVDPNTVHCDPEGQVFLLLPDYQDCNKFYICAHGVEVAQHCSPGLIFDFELQGCAWPFNGKCILRDDGIEGSGDASEGSGDDEEASGFWAPEEIDANTFDFAQENDKKITHPKFTRLLDCFRPSAASKRLPYKGDCQRYWRCSGGILESAYCSDGLFFNAQTQQCDFEGNAKCDAEVPNELDGEFIVYN